MDTFNTVVVALIVIVELYVLYRVIPIFVATYKLPPLEAGGIGATKSPPPSVSGSPNFVSSSPNSPNSSAHNQTIRQPRTQPFEPPKTTPVVVIPVPEMPIIEPPKPVVEVLKPQPEPALRSTTGQPAVPIGSVHVPASCDNYYEVLAILPDSNEAEIKSAYRSLIKIWHPDTSKLPDAQASMSAITEAYECLSQPDIRKLYDEGLKQVNL